jgi:hypothetical protein
MDPFSEVNRLGGDENPDVRAERNQSYGRNWVMTV